VFEDVVTVYGIYKTRINRKKNKRCKNAALMEFIGPRPIYCAEHIDLDPNCLYTKCQSKYQKTPGDGKGCREVVLKEFGFCHKHYPDLFFNALIVASSTSETGTITDMHGIVRRVDGMLALLKVRDKLARVMDLLDKLSREAWEAKKSDPDLFQRKNKLIPKFQDMKAILQSRFDDLQSQGFQCPPLPRSTTSAMGSPSTSDGQSDSLSDSATSATGCDSPYTTCVPTAGFELQP